MTASKRFTLDDLKNKGLVENSDGTYSKAKTVLQPREKLTIKLPTIPEQIGKYNPDFVPHKEEGWLKDIKGKMTITTPEGKKIKFKTPSTPVYFNHMDIQDVYAMCEREGKIFIPGHIPSSKNLMIPAGNRLISSPRTVAYKNKSEIHWRVFSSRFRQMCQGKEKPYKIAFTFIFPDRRRHDFHNAVQLPMDQMVSYGWIDDDNMNEVLPYPGSPAYGYDPKMPGVIISVL